jgi:lipid-A-disaccharide synthase
MTQQPEIFFITGEASGDRHAAPVVAELRARGLRVTGVGGPRMRAAGAEVLTDSINWGAMGVPEAVRKYFPLWLRSKVLLREIRRRKPAVCVLVDFGFFNTTMARHLTRGGLAPVFFYFPPGSWRQEPRDWSGLAAITDRIATPFARNAEFLKASGADAHWVGHPVVDTLEPVEDRGRLRRELGLPQDSPLIGVLPGSRIAERRILGPVLLDATQRIRSALPTARFLWSSFPAAGAVEERLAQQAQALGFFQPVTESHDILRASDFVLVAMGTATLETAAALTPMVTCYDGSRPAKWIAARVLHQQQSFYAMPNLLLGRGAVPEVVPHGPQESITGEAVAAEALRLLQDPAALEAVREDLRQVRRLLGEPGVAGRVAELIVEMV